MLNVVNYAIFIFFMKAGESVTTSEAQKRASMKYAKEKLKRIPLSVSKEKYEEIKQAADEAGESVNGFIKNAIESRMNSGK